MIIDLQEAINAKPREGSSIASHENLNTVTSLSGSGSEEDNQPQTNMVS